jgi:hypothetical protein
MIRVAPSGPLVPVVGYFNFRGSIATASELGLYRDTFVDLLNAKMFTTPPAGCAITSIWWQGIPNLDAPLPEGTIMRQILQIGPTVSGPWETLLTREYSGLPDNGGYWEEEVPIVLEGDIKVRVMQAQFDVPVVNTWFGGAKIGIQAL